MDDDEVTTRSVARIHGDGLEVEVDEARLLVEEGEDQGWDFLLPPRRVVLGRARDADLRLLDSSISRRHCSFEPRGRGWALRDLGSRAGVELNGEPVVEATLRPGDRVRLGGTELLFSQGRRTLSSEATPEDRFHDLLGRSLAMRRVFGLIRRMAGAELPVHLRGETGTGKEGLARALHLEGARAAGPYVVVDCSLLQGASLRSELFGHRAGAYTGAVGRRDGAFVAADGGTLFLDEVGELPLELQAPLLRTVETGEVRPLGDDSPRRVDVRVVSATCRDVAAMVREGSFREDLFFRLCTVVIDVPPLRDRPEDLLLLARHFLPEGVTLSQDARELLRRHRWPGNARELKGVLEVAARLSEGEVVRAGALRFPDLGPAAPGTEPAPVGAVGARGEDLGALRTEAEDAGRQEVAEALRQSGGNMAEAARRLGISRSTLYRRLQRLGMR